LSGADTAARTGLARRPGLKWRFAHGDITARNVRHASNCPLPARFVAPLCLRSSRLLGPAPTAFARAARVPVPASSPRPRPSR
jgi:hypothetical protein